MNAHHDDNGASLQPIDAERDGCLDFTRAALVTSCIALAAGAIAAGAIGSWLGAW